jgi:hypothetical protein
MRRQLKRSTIPQAQGGALTCHGEVAAHRRRAKQRV